MIDPATGAASWSKLELGPTLTRKAFRASRAGRSAKLQVKNGVHGSWRLTATDGARRHIIVLYFIGQRLSQVDICDASPRFGTSWDDWSLAKERARKRAHDAWIAASLGRRRKFGWGTVESLFDPRSGSSSIVVTYL